MRNRDIVSRRQRSEMMRRVGQRRTPIEQAVGALLTSMGRRYRFNNRRLPGSPDLSNQAQGWAIFVNGCFWHGHKNCAKTKGGRVSRIPILRRKFWKAKIEENRRRDARKCRQLRDQGFRVAIIWECQLRQADKVEERLKRMLGSINKG
jgi:DNA mismatch endonuclease (patch repair protein)